MGGSRWLHKAQNYPQIIERKKNVTGHDGTIPRNRIAAIW